MSDVSQPMTAGVVKATNGHRSGGEQCRFTEREWGHSPVVDLKDGESRVLGELLLLVLRRVRVLKWAAKETMREMSVGKNNT